MSNLIQIDWNRLKELESDRYINVQKHPKEDLFICNYTAKAQYDAVWNDYTMSCRGLIIDSQGQIKARPFRKFFNLGSEVKFDQLPDGSFEVYEKLDGSLGILYWVNDSPYIATRGSFISEQSQTATSILNSKYATILPKLNPQLTYLFEIIYPENRIVIDYGATQELFLLAIIDTYSGQELPLSEIGFPLVQPYPQVTDLRALETLAEENQEGFVIRFESGFRVKVKFAEYVRLHRIITGLSQLTIWEYLSEGKSLDALLTKLPDEVYDWVRTTSEQMLFSFQRIERSCLEVYQELPTRKETALYFQKQEYPSVLFAMLTGKDYAPIIWKKLRPQGKKTYFNQGSHITENAEPMG